MCTQKYDRRISLRDVQCAQVCCVPHNIVSNGTTTNATMSRCFATNCCQPDGEAERVRQDQQYKITDYRSSLWRLFFIRLTQVTGEK